MYNSWINHRLQDFFDLGIDLALVVLFFLKLTLEFHDFR